MSGALSSPPATLLLGHRGASAHAPENTLTAFRLALEHGAAGVELDVQLSADGVPVVIHDATLDRTTSGAGPVAGATAAELARLDAGDGAGVPTLAACCAWAMDTGAWINVELKAEGSASPVLDVLDDAGARDRVLLSSFSLHVLEDLRALGADAPRYLLRERAGPALLPLARELDVAGVCLHRDAIDDHVLRELTDASLRVVAWTVDAPERIRWLLRRRIHALISNDPRSAVAVARELADSPRR